MRFEVVIESAAKAFSEELGLRWDFRIMGRWIGGIPTDSDDKLAIRKKLSSRMLFPDAERRENFA